jgi:hypothetical protein
VRRGETVKQCCGVRPVSHACFSFAVYGPVLPGGRHRTMAIGRDWRKRGYRRSPQRTPLARRSAAPPPPLTKPDHQA